MAGIAPDIHEDLKVNSIDVGCAVQPGPLTRTPEEYSQIPGEATERVPIQLRGFGASAVPYCRRRGDESLIPALRISWAPIRDSSHRLLQGLESRIANLLVS